MEYQNRYNKKKQLPPLAYCFPHCYVMLQVASSLGRMDQSKSEGEELNKHICNSKNPQAVFPHFKHCHHQTTHSEPLPNGTRIKTPVSEYIWNVKMLVKNKIIIKDALILTEIRELEQMVYIFVGSYVFV